MGESCSLEMVKLSREEAGMKEEVGMNRSRGPSKALLALAMAGLVGWSAQTARAENDFNVYTNFRGLSGVLANPLDQPAAGVAEGRRAGMTLNPGHVGQWLW